MPSASIENPVINSPYEAPSRHFRFDDSGITDEIVEARRPSEFFVPVPQTKKAGAQLQFDNEWTRERLKSNDFINQVRGRVETWRSLKYPYVTATTERLLKHWADPARENKVLFCQREAAETAIYLLEAAQKDGQGWMLNHLHEQNSEFNAGLPRIALKMATGTGKTVVMAMLIAWQTLNKAASPQDRRFAKRFLVVTPGITIRDRLRVLQPEDPGNYYRERDLVPADMRGTLGQAQVFVTNFHVFLPRVTKEAVGLAKVTKDLLLGGSVPDADPFVEKPEQVAARVARELGLQRGGEILVFNDEAHHCYREKSVDRVDEELDVDEKGEVETREEEARVWFKGLHAVRARLGIKTIYDLSATPFFLAGSGYGQGTLFPWVVSDFSLVDAIESGIVKVPRVPVDDNTSGDTVVFRNLWDQIALDLPRRAPKSTGARAEEPMLPAKLEAALYSLYANYEKAFKLWESDGAALGETPPVFIVVCNNTTVSKLVSDWISGYDREGRDVDGEVVTLPAPGKLDLFSNVAGGAWTDRPRTLLIDSAQLESGQQLTPEFRALAAREIDEFKAVYRHKFPGRDPEEVDDATLLREVMNTVGKRGKLGEHIRCVVSVSMLTEGWDANTVTHILGVRAFRTPLLTEQVVGRGLRRRSYTVNEDGLFDPEYAEIYGVPFAFIPASGVPKDPKPRRAPIRVWADPARVEARISFPRLLGYRLEMPDPDLDADFSASQAAMSLTTTDLPTKAQISDLTGTTELHTIPQLQGLRPQAVAFQLAHRLLDREFRDRAGNPRPWLFPQILEIVKRWMSEAVQYEADTYPGLLLLQRLREEAVEKICKAIVTDETQRRERILPIFDSTQPDGSTDGVDFDTTRIALPASSDRSHVTHVVLDGPSGNTWEERTMAVLEDISGVAAYVKNDHLGFTIPYTHQGQSAHYIPDFLARLDPNGDEDTRTLIIEVSGGQKSHHSPGTVAEKAATARDLWVPAVNRNGSFGLWSYIEIKDPHEARQQVRDAAEELLSASRGVVSVA